MDFARRLQGPRSQSSRAPVVALSVLLVPVARIMIVCAIACATTTASAADDDSAVLIQAGDGDRAVRSVAVGYTHGFAPVDRASTSRWSFYGEAVIGEWFVHRPAPGDRDAFTQLTFAPVVRYDLGRFVTNVFVEAGVGLSVIAPNFRDHERVFSTTFNFDDHASLGFRFGDRGADELSVRAEHFSNGGIRNPNPGQNFGQLRFAHHF